jgi:hypothetical protein
MTSHEIVNDCLEQITAVELIKQQLNYETLGKLMLDETFVVTKELLENSCLFDDSGILRLLLLHHTADPNLVLIDSVEHSNIDIIIALIEDKRTIITPNIFITACKLGRHDVVKLFLKDIRFDPSKSATSYLYECIKNDKIEVVRCLIQDDRIKPWILNGLINSCAYKNIPIFEEISKKFPFTLLDNVNSAKILINTAINSYDAELLKKVIIYTNGTGIDLESAQACLPSGKGSLFKVIIKKLDDKSLKKLLYICIQKNLSTKIGLIYELNKIKITVEEIIYSINNNSVHSLNKLIDLGVLPCYGGICAIKGAIVNKKDDIISGLISNDNVINSCVHHIENLQLSISHKCYKTTKQFLDCIANGKKYTQGSTKLSDRTLDNILYTGDTQLVGAMLQHVSVIPSYKIKKCMRKGYFDAIKIICENTVVDLSWNNYELLRYAASFSGPEAYNSLLPNLKKRS